MSSNSYQRALLTKKAKFFWKIADEVNATHYATLLGEINATAINQYRLHMEKEGLLKPSYTSVVIKAAAKVMGKNLSYNQMIFGPKWFPRKYQFKKVNISVAIEQDFDDYPGIPYYKIIQEPNRKTPSEITQVLADYRSSGELQKEFDAFGRTLEKFPLFFTTLFIKLFYLFPSLWTKYQGGSVVNVNSPAKYGADFVFTAWPGTVTFSFGLVKNRPFVIDDNVNVVPTMPIVMVFDRRVIGGGPAVRVFKEFCDVLEGFKSDDH